MKAKYSFYAIFYMVIMVNSNLIAALQPSAHPSPMMHEFMQARLSKTGVSSLEKLANDTLLRIMDFVGRRPVLSKKASLSVSCIPRGMAIYDHQHIVVTQNKDIMIVNCDTFSIKKTLVDPSARNSILEIPIDKIVVLLTPAKVTADDSGYTPKNPYRPQAIVSNGSSAYYTAKVWDPHSGNHSLVRQGRGDYSTTALVHLGGESVATGDCHGTITLWKINHIARIHTRIQQWRGSSQAIVALALLPTGALVSGDSNGCIKTWDMWTGKCLTRCESKAYIFALTVSPNGIIISGAYDDASQKYCTKSWDSMFGRPIRTFQEPHSPLATALVVIPPHYIASGGLDGTIMLWDINSGACLDRIQKAHNNKIWSLVYTKDLLISTGEDNMIQSWKVRYILDCARGDCSVKTLPPALPEQPAPVFRGCDNISCTIS